MNTTTDIAFPVLMAVLAFAVMWGGVVVRMKYFNTDIQDLKKDKLDEREHNLLCDNSRLEFEKHVTKEFLEFENRFLPKIKKLFNGKVG